MLVLLPAYVVKRLIFGLQTTGKVVNSFKWTVLVWSPALCCVLVLDYAVFSSRDDKCVCPCRSEAGRIQHATHTQPLFTLIFKVRKVCLILSP